MKHLLLAALLACSTAQAAEWDRTDKVLFGTFMALQVVDTAQTWRIHDNADKWVETNPLFGERPNMALVVGTKILATGALYYVADHSSSTMRKVLLGAADALFLSVTANNYAIGLKFGF